MEHRFVKIGMVKWVQFIQTHLLNAKLTSNGGKLRGYKW